MKVRRRLFAFLLAAFLVFLLIPTQTALANYGKVKIGFYEYPGFQERDPNYEYYVGFIPEYLQEIARYTGWNYEYVYGSLEECQSMLADGRIDILGGVSLPETPPDGVTYSKLPNGMNYSMLIISAADTRYGYEDFRSFDGMTVATLKGSNDAEHFSAYSAEHGFSATIVEYPYIEAMLTALRDGLVDGAIVSYLGKNSGFTDIARFAPSPFYFAVSTMNPEIIRGVDDAMNAISLQNPYYEKELYKRYFPISYLERPVFSQTQHAFIDSASLVRAVYINRESPLCYTQAGECAGIIRDIFDKLAAFTGLKFTFIEAASKEEAFALLAAGEADMICDTDKDYRLAKEYALVQSGVYLSTPVVRVRKNTAVSSVVAMPENGFLTGLIHNEGDYATLHYYESERACFAALYQGLADETYVDMLTANYLLANARYSAAFSVAVTGYSVDLCAGIAQTADPVLAEIIDKAIRYLPAEEISEITFHNTVGQNSFSLIDFVYRRPLESLLIVSVVFGGIIFVLVYIIRLKNKNNREIQNLLYVDRLTGYWNLNKFSDHAALVLKGDASGYALVSCDINHFKTINDAYGFAEGDYALRLVADTLQASLASGEFFARSSADFFVLMVKYTDFDALCDRMAEVNRKVNAALLEDDRQYQLVIIAGIYKIQPQDCDISFMLDLASYARKSAKGMGKNSCVLYNFQMRNEILSRKEIEDHMELALQNGEFCPYFQPKADLLSGTIVGCEALVRWIKPSGEIVSPGAFIPIFEQNGFVVDVDLFIYESVCKTIRKWLATGKDVVRVSCNFSRLHLMNASFSDTLKSIADQYRVPTCYLEIEITESMSMYDPEVLLTHLKKLKEYGFMLAVDDFGSGYSSLGLLHQFPFDVLKMDKSLLGHDDDSISEQEQVIIFTILHMAEGLGMEIVCEGVETDRQADILSGLGCRVIQGFLFSRPLALPDFEALLAAKNSIPPGDM